MFAGYDRYFQIARCFRDEDLRADRQPEFTQIDIEMSFVDQEDVLRVVEDLFRHLFRTCLDVDIGSVPRLTHAEALLRYGSDKPDLRIPHQLVDLTDDLRETGFRVFDEAVASGGRILGLRVPDGAGESRSTLDRWTDAARSAGARGLVWIRRSEEGWRSSIDKFIASDRWDAPGRRAGLEPGDLLLVAADRAGVAATALGTLRTQLARDRGWIEEGTWRLAWIVDFPLFETDEEGRIGPSHHAFTSPSGGLESLAGDPLETTAKAYDLVLNGYELGSGSIRIHDRALQERVFEILGIGAPAAREKFGFLLDAFEYGAPPHGGFAIGLDRTAMLFAGADSLRGVIAFPKTTSAAALLEGSPSSVEEADLADLHIRLIPPPTTA